MHIDIEKAFRLSTPCLRYDNFFQKKAAYQAQVPLTQACF